MNKQLITLINSVSEGGLLPDTDTHKLRFDVKSSSSNRLYRVSVRKSTGAFECGCPGWIRHRKCKHIQAVAPVLEQALKLLALK